MDNFLDVLGDFSFDEIDTSGAGGDYTGFNFDAYGDTSGGTEGDDYIANSGDSVKILALGGEDTIENVGSYVYIDGGTEGDQIINTDGGGYYSGSFVFINGGEGDDTIQNGDESSDGGDNVTITGGAGNDYIENNNYHDGDISNSANALISGGDGDDTIYNHNAPDATLLGGAGNDYINNIIDGGANALIGGGTGDDEISNDGANSTILGGSGNDKIYSEADNVSINGDDGNDTIENFLTGSYTSINAGDGNDSILNNAVYVTINGGTGDDTITNNYGSNVSINGGDGNDLIKNDGEYGEKTTIGGGAGNDLISLGSSAQNNLIVYNVGDGNDLIQGFNDTSTLQIGGGSGTYSMSTSGDDLIVTVGEGSIILQGAASLESVNINGEEISLTPEWTLSGTTATYGTANETLITVTGVKSLDGISLDGTTVTIAKASVNAKNITISDGYNLALADDVTKPGTTNAWAFSGTTATYNQTTSAGYTLTNNEIIYSKKSTTPLVTVEGVTSKDGLTIDEENKIVTVGTNSLGTSKVTVSDGYNLALADDVTKPGTTNAWAFSGTTATYNQTTSAGYTLTNNEIIYSKKSTTPLVTVEGVTSKDGLTIDKENKIVTVSATSLGTNEVTISDGYTLALADDVETSSTKTADWSLEGTTATYNSASTTEGYILSSDGKSISYSGETTATSLATVKGATSTGGLTISGNTIKLAAGSLSSVVTVASDDYGFEFASGYKSAKITGTGSDDTIKTAGQKVTVNAGKGDDVITVSGKYSSVVGGAGNDLIKNTGANVSISAGKGNDTIENTGDNVVFTYTSGDGNDLIRGYNETSTLQVSNSSFSMVKSGDDVIVSVDSAKITLEGAASLFNDNVPIWYMLDTDVAVFGTESETYLTVSGVKSSYGFVFDGTTVIIPSSALNKKNVTITDGYKLAVDDDVKEPTTITEATWSLDGTTATYTSAATTEGYTLSSDGKSIIYNAAQEATDLLTVKGVKALTGLSLSGTVVTVAKASLTNKNVTISDGYTLKLASNVAAPSTVDAEWKLEDTTATYYGELTTKGYTLASDAKSIKYSKATTAAALASIEGATSTDGLTINGNTIKATTASELDKIIYLGSDDYGFEFVSGYKSANINGSGGDDTIKAAGQKVTINGGDGNDSIVATGKYALVDGGDGADFITASGAGASLGGGKGNDTLTGGSGANVFLYANDEGNDIITDYSETQGDKIKITSGTITTITTSKTNVVFTVGKGKLTVQNASEQIVTYIDADGEEKFYTNKSVRYNDAGTSATLTTNYTEDNFTPTEYADYSKTLQTIDASAVTQELTIEGNKLANKITGSTQNDFINGYSGADVLYGGAGADTLAGSGGNDKLFGEAGNDSLSGGSGEDTLVGGKGRDSLTGGAGADLFVFNVGDGANVITDYSEAQGDIISINAAASSIKYEIGKSNVLFTFGTSDRVTLKNSAEQAVTFVDADGVETVINNKSVLYNDAGTSATLTSNYTEDEFTPTEYADYSKTLQTIDASAVEHELTIEGNKLANNITGSGQNDFINGYGGADVLYGGAGADTLAGSGGNDSIFGDEGNDSLSGGSGEDTLVGGKGRDSLTGGAGADLFVFNVGDGKNVITDYNGAQGDVISINADVSSIKYEVGKSNVVFTFGTSDRVTLKNAAEQAVTFVDANGINPIPPSRPVEYNDAGTSATLTTNYTEDNFTSTEYSDYASTLKTIDASAVEHDLTIEGNKLANNIIGSTQNDFINGYSGTDVLYGGAGADTLAGSGGNDKLYGEAGNDSLSGGSGEDTLVGGAGNDTLTGGAGADVFSFSVGDGKNVITDYNGAQGDVISINAAASSIKYEIGKSNVLFTFGKSDRVTLKNSADQEITFVDDSNTTYYVNKPIIYNEANTAATLTADYEAKTFTPNEYADYATTLVTIDASAVTHALTITGNNKANRITGSSQNDTIDGAESNDKLYGGSGNDSLKGGSGNDYLSGGNDDDTLWGGKGSDTLVGGKGYDTFIYNDGDGNDVINGYQESIDKIILNSGKIEALYESGNDIIFEIGTGSITVKDASNKFVALYDGDGNVLRPYHRAQN